MGKSQQFVKNIKSWTKKTVPAHKTITISPPFHPPVFKINPTIIKPKNPQSMDFIINFITTPPKPFFVLHTRFAR